MSLPDTFWAKTATTDCLIWTGAQNSKGYGCFAIDRKSHLAHRLAWEDASGPIPDDMTIDHLCRVHACVNVAHMELVSRKENTLRQPRTLKPGGECRYGHHIETEADIYRRRPDGPGECRACRLERPRRKATPGSRRLHDEAA